MLILILIDVQYLQKAAFNFEKGSNSQNHSSSGSYHLVKNFLTSKISNSPIPYHYLENPVKTAFMFLGASPDGPVTCDCHQPAVTEIVGYFCNKGTKIRKHIMKFD